MRAPLGLATAALAGATVLHVRDPHSAGSYGLCPFHAVTGLWCPGCGGLRALHDLTHLDVVAAVSSNVLAVALVAVLAVAYLRWLPQRWQGVRARMIVLSPRSSQAVLVLLGVYTVVRNIPAGAWFAP